MNDLFDDIHIQEDGMRLIKDWITKFIDQEEKEKMNQKAKEKILTELRKGELSRNKLYRAVRGDRMGGYFDWALRCLNDDQMIEIARKKTGNKGRPGEMIRLCRIGGGAENQ
jgi:hypothetical protein